jgi:hypothetical protein
VDTLKHAIKLRRTKAGLDAASANTKEETEAMQRLTKDDLHTKLRALLRQLDSCAWNQLWCAAKDMLLKDGLCGQPTPAEFAALLDANEALLGFNNGVFSLTDMTFYAAGPDFPRNRLLVSMSAGYDFIARHTLNEQQLATLARLREHLLHALGSDESSQRAIKAFMGSILHGGCSVANIFLLAHGGASTNFNTSRLHSFQQQICKTMGEYAGALDCRQLSNAAASPDAANSSLAACRRKRVCFLVHGAGALTVSDSAVATFCMDVQKNFRSLYQNSESDTFQASLQWSRGSCLR